MMLIVTEWTKVLSQYLTHVMMQATSNAVLGHLRSPLARELNQKDIPYHACVSNTLVAEAGFLQHIGM